MTPRFTLTLAALAMAWLPAHADTLKKIADSKTVVMGAASAETAHNPATVGRSSSRLPGRVVCHPIDDKPHPRTSGPVVIHWMTSRRQAGRWGLAAGEASPGGVRGLRLRWWRRPGRPARSRIST